MRTLESCHPVRDALERAAVAMCAQRLMQLQQGLGDGSDGLKAKSLAKQAAVLADDVTDIIAWLYPYREAATVEQIEQCRVMYCKAVGSAGFSAEEEERLFRSLAKAEVGRRHRHPLHVRAFELMLQSRECTLGAAVKQLCPCGNGHTAKCTSSFKAGIRDLKKLLRRHAPQLVSRYDELHPDRTQIGKRNLQAFSPITR